MSIRFAAALTAGKFCAAVLGAFFPKRGSNMPGAIALKFDPLFLSHIKGVDPAKTIFITGTNGKSTANNMVVHTFETAGHTVCSNIEGANMKAGIASAVIKSTSAGGRFVKDYLILEIDERSLAGVAKDLPPGHLCVTNIQKDQVQRNGDPDYIYQKIGGAIRAISAAGAAGGFTLYVNNDEPRCKSLESFLPEGRRARSYGVAQNARSAIVEKGWGVTMPCPLCHDALEFTRYNLAGVGAFLCPNCGFASDGTPDVRITGVDFENESFRVSVKGGQPAETQTPLPEAEDRGEACRLAYPAAFFLYNYALCACVGAALGIDAETRRRAFDTFSNIGGRMEDFLYKGKHIHYMRIKQENPETLQSALDTMAVDRSEKVFVFGPAIVDDIVPHYSNTFYTFDCNFEPLVASGLERCICFGSVISLDAANRLRYAGVPDENIDVIDTDDDEEILAAIAACRTDNIYLITWIKKYERLKRRAG